MIRFRYPLKRKTMITVTIVVTLLVVVTAVLYVVLYRANTEAATSVTSAKQLANSKLSDLNGTLSNSKTTPIDKRAAITHYSTGLEAIKTKTICPQKTLVYYQFLETKSRCEDKTQKLDAYNLKVHALEQYLADEAALAGIVTPLTKKDVTFSDQQKYWADLSHKVAALKVTGNAKTLQTTTAKVLTDYADAWGALDGADRAKDKAAFEAGKERLAAAYQALSELRTSGEVKLIELQKAAQIAYVAYLQ